MSIHKVGMNTKTVPLLEGATGAIVTCEMAVCPACDGNLWLVYIPEGIGHVHFQCRRCGVSYCDGCTKETTNPPTTEGKR